MYIKIYPFCFCFGNLVKKCIIFRICLLYGGFLGFYFFRNRRFFIRLFGLNFFFGFRHKAYEFKMLLIHCNKASFKLCRFLLKVGKGLSFFIYLAFGFAEYLFYLSFGVGNNNLCFCLGIADYIVSKLLCTDKHSS